MSHSPKILRVALLLAGSACWLWAGTPPGSWETLQRKAVALFAEHSDWDAVQAAQKAAQAARREFGRNDPRLAESLQILLVSYLETDQYGEGVQAGLEALEIQRIARVPEVPVRMRTLDLLASVYGLAGEWEQAINASQASLLIRERAFGTNSLAVTLPLNAQFIPLLSRNRIDEAAAVLRRVIAIKEKRLGQDHRETLFTRYALAQVYTQKGDTARAEIELKKCLAGLDRVPGSDPADRAGMMTLLANACSRQGRTAEAGSLLKDVLAIREKKFGLYHSETARALHELGLFYAGNGDPGLGESMLRRSLAVRERIRDTDTFDQALTLQDLGRLLAAEKRYLDAESVLQLCLEYSLKKYGPLHSWTADCWSNLALVALEQDYFVQARAAIRQALAIYQTVYGPRHSTVGNSLRTLARIYEREGNQAVAAQYWQDAMEILEPRGPERTP